MEKKSVGLLELETAVLECFLEKTPLSPLGVKSPFQCSFQVQFSIQILSFGINMCYILCHGNKE
jgi:hypothetical protein